MADLLWTYQAEDRTGNIIRGEIAAASEETALDLLKRDNLSPLSLSHASRARDSQGQDLFAQSVLGLKDYASFTRGLADLLTSGISLPDALELLAARQGSPRISRFLRAQLKNIRSGMAFSASLEKSAARVPRLMTALTAAGEASGTLGLQLLTVAETFEAQVKLRRELTSQLIYPAALLIMITATLAFLSYFVLPQFETIFAGADTLPPPETQAVLAIGAWVRDYGMLLPAGVLIILLVGMTLKKRYLYQISQILLTLPVMGPNLLKADAGRYCRSLGALVTGGTSLAKAMPIASKAVASPVLQERYEKAAKNIRAGQGFSSAMEEAGALSEDALSLAEIGEASGKLGPMLIKAADLSEADIKQFLTRLTTLAGPVLTALMGLLTAAVIAAVMSGVLSLNDAVY